MKATADGTDETDGMKWNHGSAGAAPHHRSHFPHHSHFPHASHSLERPIGAANAALDAESAAVLETIKGLLA